MNVNALAVGLVIHPIAFIYISVDMGKLAESVRSIIFPIALIACTIAPDLLAIAVAEPTDPLTRVLRTGRVGVRRPLLTLCVRVVGRV